MLRKTKIYLITECPYAGILVAMKELSAILVQMNFEVHFLLPEKTRDRYGETQTENEDILKLYGTITRVPLRRAYRYLFQDIGFFKDFFKDKQSDILISYTSYAGKISRLLYMSGILNNVYHSPNCVQTKRFKGMIRFIEWLFEKFLSKQAKYYLSCGASECYILSEQFKIPPKKLLLCPNFRTEKIFGAEEKKYEFIYLGRMVSDKGVETLLRVFENLGMLNKILFIGDGYQLKDWTAKYPDAQFLGRLSNSETMEYLRKSKYMVSASLMEGLSYSLIEAMSHGIIPIVSDVEGHRDIVINGYNGFLFENPMELCNLIFKLQLTSKELYMNLSVNATKSAEDLRIAGIKAIKDHFKTIS